MDMPGGSTSTENVQHAFLDVNFICKEGSDAIIKRFISSFRNKYEYFVQTIPFLKQALDR